MRWIWISVISFLTISAGFTPSKRIITQTIPFNHHVKVIKSDLIGTTKVIHDEIDHLVVTTSITYDSMLEEVLDYAIGQGHFELEGNYNLLEDCLTIATKRINTSIYNKGQKYRTKQQYEIVLPAHLSYVDCER